MELPIITDYQGHNLFEYYNFNKKNIQKKLTEAGAVLFRDTNIKNGSEFESFLTKIKVTKFEYIYRSTPRTNKSEHIYTSTEYNNKLEIILHNENSYQNIWPNNMWFYCDLFDCQGGETTVASNRLITKSVPKSIKKLFEEKKLLYVRNFKKGVDIPWEVAFQSDNKKHVEKYCKANKIEFEWHGDGTLTTKQLRPAVISHPKTKEKLWFNQAHLFHSSSLDNDLRSSLVSIYGNDNLPRNVYFGNGQPIDDSIIMDLKSVYEKSRQFIRWQEKDVLFLDNLLTCHGRSPFVGRRTILVSLTEPSITK